MFEPVIKWSGSKRSQAEEILKYFPQEIDTYYEPFCGGCSVLRRLLEADISVKKYVCSDINEDLINLWNMIKKEPMEVINHYTELWGILNKDSDLDRKREYFNEVRNRLNKEHNPLDFMFIMRTTTNGMPRYNKSGAFNNSFHITRNGIKTETFKDIVYEWSELLNKNDVEFHCLDYSMIKPNKEDLVYLDPPYNSTKGMYYGKIDNDLLFEWLKKLSCVYIMSYDGKSGDIDNTYDLPTDLYDKHIYLKSGNSSFKRTIGKSIDSMVYESLYIREN